MRRGCKVLKRKPRRWRVAGEESLPDLAEHPLPDEDGGVGRWQCLSGRLLQGGRLRQRHAAGSGPPGLSAPSLPPNPAKSEEIVYHGQV